MKVRIRICVIVFAFVAVSAARALAHPMGNFSVNHNTSIDVERGGIRIALRIDIAEIPAVEEMKRLDINHDGEVSAAEKTAYLRERGKELLQLQTFRVNGKEMEPQTLRLDLVITPGAGDLPTLLLVADYRIPIDPGSGRNVFEYADRSFEGRTGWREITARAERGAKILESNVAQKDLSKGLSVYPAEAATAPPQVSSARIAFLLTGAATRPAASGTMLARAQSPARPDEPLARLLGNRQSAWWLVFSLPIAFALGMFHAMSPGHAKTIVAAYLVGARGTAWHALLLGVVVTMTHTAGVFLLGLVVLFASGRLMPEALYPWLGFASGMMIFCVGSWQFLRRWAAAYVGVAMAGNGHGHVHATVSRGGLIALGFSGGIVPCPSALIVMLSAIALHAVGAGLVLIVAFSFGLATVLILIGLAVVHSQQLLERWKWEAVWAGRLQMFSSWAVSVLGLAIVVQSLRAAGKL